MCSTPLNRARGFALHQDTSLEQFNETIRRNILPNWIATSAYHLDATGGLGVSNKSGCLPWAGRIRPGSMLRESVLCALALVHDLIRSAQQFVEGEAVSGIYMQGSNANG